MLYTTDDRKKQHKRHNIMKLFLLKNYRFKPICTDDIDIGRRKQQN